MSHILEQQFPLLQPTGYTITSPQTQSYNCIAWAAGDVKHWWWPDPSGCAFWPANAPRVESVEAFIEAYRSLGYELCASHDLEMGVEKVALYVANGQPSHAARQLTDGGWTSKCGRLEDIRHTLEGLVGDMYGQAVMFLSRHRASDTGITV